MVKEEPEDSFDFHELFPVVNECPFSSLTSNDTLGLEPIETKPSKVETNIPPLWYIEKGKIDDEFRDGKSVPQSKSLSELGITKGEAISTFLPREIVLASDVAERAQELKEQEKIYHENFLSTILNKYPVDNTYHANKARKYSQDTLNVDESKRQTKARKDNNDKSIESRYKKKVERAVNAYSIIHLRERILEYQTRMNIMKELLLQTNANSRPIDEQSTADDLSSVDESDMESLSSFSSY